MPRTEETQYPGAGTLYVYSASPHRGISPSRSNKRRQSPSAWATIPTKWEDIVTVSALGRPCTCSERLFLCVEEKLMYMGTQIKEEPVTMATPDSLLQNGIAEFTYLPYSSEGVLGRGKFSTVYKVTGSDGNYVSYHSK